MKKVSVIVPIYNGERYLHSLISSILNQNYKNVELILINDGSTDRSLDICNEYKSKDKRIVILNKQNEGISAARNSGILISTGIYIVFVDQDDIISKDIYSNLVTGIEEYNSDMAISGKTMQLIDVNNSVIQSVNFEYPNKTLLNDSLFFEIINWDRRGSIQQIWNCIYKKSIIVENNIKFDVDLKHGYEDTLFNIEYVTKCRSVRLLRGNVYKYLRREGISTSLKKNKDYIIEFNEFVISSSNAVEYYKLSKMNKKIFQMYLLRIAINLFRQYANTDSQEEDLYTILNTVTEQTGRICTCFYCCNNIF